MTSRKKNSWILVCCVVALFILIFFEPSYGWRVRQWLSPNPAQPLSQASADAQVLQAQLAQLQSVASEIPQNPHNEIRAMVYVQYPFGFKNQLLVNAGSDERVAVGKAVTFQNVFIGTVVQIFPQSAVVQTVFDPAFKMPVRVGGVASGGNAVSYDALLVGGADPKATSIAKTASLAIGDIIYTASPGLPYGLPIGAINTTNISSDNLFQEATVNFGYDIANVQTVLIAQ